jgi:alpha-galactosidase
VSQVSLRRFSMAHENVRKTAAVNRNRLQLDRNVRSHTLTRAELGLAAQGSYTLADVLTAQLAPTPVDATISVTLPPHFVRVLKLLRSDTPAVPPALLATVPPTGNAGEMLRFSARPASEAEPILQYTWNFGDGTSVSGVNVAHASTHAGTYEVCVHATGLAASSSDQSKSLTIRGAVFTKYAPGAKRRLEATTS